MTRLLIILTFLVGSIAIGQSESWGSHSAHLIQAQRWEVGVFQPFRYGLSEDLEYSVHPAWFFVMPNISFKRSQADLGSFKTATRFNMVYPTPLLNMVSKEDIGGLIDPNITMPPMLGLSGSFLMSKDIFGISTTSKVGVDIGLTMGELDARSNIDLPLVYHRLEVFHNKWGVHAGLDLTKDITRQLELFIDLDLRLLPDLDKGKNPQRYSMRSGDYSIEHKLLLAWSRTSRFRVFVGYKLVSGDFPHGKETRLLPYLPMLEKWIPLVELQWSK